MKTTQEQIKLRCFASNVRSVVKNVVHFYRSMSKKLQLSFNVRSEMKNL